MLTQQPLRYHHVYCSIGPTTVCYAIAHTTNPTRDDTLPNTRWRSPARVVWMQYEDILKPVRVKFDMGT